MPELLFEVGDAVYIHHEGEYGEIIAVDRNDPDLPYCVEWDEGDDTFEDWFSEDELSF